MIYHHKKILELGYKIIIGIELEFYIHSENIRHDIVAIRNYISKHFPNFSIEKEQGENQFELKSLPTNDINQLICEIKQLKIRMSDIFNGKIIFLAKPFSNKPGSAMHINISLIDDIGNNIFAKNNNKESIFLLHAIGGLCSSMKKNLKYFLPNEQSLTRIKMDQNAPKTISWGSNNRTVAIRVPTTDSQNRRIEHRVSSADADVEIVIEKILSGIYFGLTEKISPPKKIWGNASDKQYNMEKLF